MKEPIIRFQDIYESAKGYMPEADVAPLRKAYIFAAVAHKGQHRKSGLPYLSHPLAVTKILTDLKMDIPALSGGLLHDVIEDCDVDENTLRGSFGDEIAQLVTGLTKTGKVRLHDKKQQKLESYRKMLVAMSRDVRVLMIKLADRLHNMRTLYYLSEEQQKRISQETLAIYAPLANRLGISWLRSELEDLSFQYIKPEVCQEIKERVAEQVKVKTEVIEIVSDILKERLAKEAISCEILGRVKHNYSIYRKMMQQGIPLDQIFDLFALRIIVQEEKHCYQVLGLVHSLWSPVPSRFKDYIAKPKLNQYRSLHSTVVGPTGDCVEVQIRSQTMNLEAEQGVAAHWMYKEKAGFNNKDEKTFNWLRQVLNTLQEISEPENFLDVTRFDLFPDQVYVLTPRGEVKELPRGASPIDFAYKIHTEIGHHCTGAKIGGKLVPLKYELQNGDVVEILTSKNQSPNKDWLSFVKTPDARSRIRAWLRKEESEQSHDLGREILEKGLRKIGLQYNKLVNDGDFKAVLKTHNFRNMETFLRAVAYGRLSLAQVISALPGVNSEQVEAGGDSKEWDKDLEKLVEKVGNRSDAGVQVRGVPNIMVRFAKCCNPVHGEEIIGFITRGRGVTIHAQACSKVGEGDKDRWIEAQWQSGSWTMQRAKIRVVCDDRPGLLAGITKAIAKVDVNISQAKAWTTRDDYGIFQFEVNVKNLTHLKELIHCIEKVKSVLSVERLLN